MLFNSYEFLFVFLPITWFLWFTCCKTKKASLTILVLTVASFVFYSWWNPIFILLLLFSIVFNFVFGVWVSPVKKALFYVDNPKTRKLLLVIGIAVNLGLIGYFKYFNFFMATIADAIGFTWQTAKIFLPLGISFFTFQQIAWLVDSFKGDTPEMAADRGVWNQLNKYALFVAFFPQLIAGPIVNHKELIPQLQNQQTFKVNWHNVATGLALISIGLFKKVVIADALSPLVANGFDNNFTLTFFEAWLIAFAYTFQLYFDFSGYSDMAVGLGKMFNIDLPINFKSPYKTTSIIDFWRCWHITLSCWLRDYLYIPLGGNRKGESRRYINLFMTMLLGGLWHGAAWTFVFWGFLHGLYLCINHLWRKLKIPMPKTLAWLITFAAITVAWIFFRAPDIARALSILESMLGLNGFYAADWLVNIFNGLGFSGVHAFAELKRPIIMAAYLGKNAIFIMLLFVVVLCFRNSNEIVKARLKIPQIRYAIFYGLCFAIAIGYFFRVSEFLYFQF